MPRGIRKKARQYVLDRFQEEDPESYFKYKMHSGLNQDQMELLQVKDIPCLAVDNQDDVSVLIQEAVSSQSVHLVKALLNKGIDPNFTVVPGQVTPLHIAVKNYVQQSPASEKILRALLFFGANTEASDSNGNTSLHEACKCHSIDSVELLIQAGADLNCCNNLEETPLMTACRYAKDPSLVIVGLLLSADAITIMTNSDGQTALHILSACAASEPTYEMVRHEIALVLMKQGLRADEEDRSGKTPLSYEILQMSRCSSNPALGLDLLKKGSSICAVTGTAICLVQGGAMHSSAYTKEMEVLIHTVPVHSHSLAILHAFLGAIRNYVSQAVWKKINKMVSRVNHRSSQIVSMQSSLGLQNPEVSSLAQLAKITTRTSLQGTVIRHVDLLSIPEKMKAYLLSEN